METGASTSVVTVEALGPPPPKPRRWRRRLMVVGTVAAVLGSAVVVMAQQSSGSPPKHPKAWDPRITKLVDFVEKDRDLDFKQPVYVDFLAEAEYKSSAAFKAQKMTEEDKRDLRQVIVLLRSFGLLEGDPDLVQKLEQLNAEGTLAYYDPKTERVTVRGTQLNDAVRGTLVHELTHALQDQHFGLDSLTEDHQDRQASAAAGWLRDLTEGDAVRVEQHWAAKLDAKAFAVYEKGHSGDEADLEGIPDVVLAAFSTSYTYGNALVELIDARGGNSAVDAAFRSPPTSDEQVFDAFRYLDKDAPETVAPPALKPGEVLAPGSESDTFGSFMLFVTLAPRLGAVKALHAVDGWGGDQFVSFSRGAQQCTRVDFATDTPADGDELLAALKEWTKGAPAGLASVGRSGELVELESCDPGADHKPGGGSMREALAVPLTRTNVAAGVMSAGRVPEDKALCYANGIVEAFTSEQLASDELSPADEAKMKQIAGRCLT